MIIVTILTALALFLALPVPGHAAPMVRLDSCLAQNVMTESFMGSGFRSAGGACSFGFDDVVRGAVRTQISQWLLGFQLDVGFLSRLAEMLREKDAQGIEIRSNNASGGSSITPPQHRSFFLKASRKRVLLGFTLEW